MSTQIFACDHRKNVQWNLPYIRIGGPESDCAINIKDDEEIAPYSVLLSEGAKIWWVWKHLAEFGNPDYIGFCHYRRFYGQAQVPIYDIPEIALARQHLFSPSEQELMMKKNSADGLVPAPFCPLQKSQKYNYSNIIEQTKMISDADGQGFTTEVVNKAFELLLSNFPSAYRSYMEKAFLNDKIYVCNIFTMKSSLFQIYGSTIASTVKQLAKFVEDKDTTNFHKRWMGYIMERFTSSIIQAFQLAGHRFLVAPLITIDGWKHEPFEKHVGK